MRFFLITTFCVACALALGESEDRSKREILPGDPRYGYHYPTPQKPLDYASDVEIVKSSGGYVGSYSVPDYTGSYQDPQSSYGPPDHRPGKPINHYIPQLPQIVEIGKKENQLSSIEYQNNDQASEQVDVTNVGVKSAFNTPVTSYGTPVTHAETAAHTETETHEDDLAASVASQNSISTPAISEEPPLFSDAKVNEESVESGDVQTSTQLPETAVEVKSDASAFAAPLPSYGAPVVEADSQNSAAPVTSYGTPVSQVPVEGNSFPSSSTVDNFAEHTQPTIPHSPTLMKIMQYALKAVHNSHNQDYHSNTFGNSFGSTFQNFGSVGSFSGFEAPSAGPGGPSQATYYSFPINQNHQSVYSVHQPSTSFQNVQHYPTQYTSLQASGPQFHAGSQVLVHKTYSPSVVQHQVSTASFNNNQNTYTSVGAFNSHRISSDFEPFRHPASVPSVNPKNYYVQSVDKNGGYLYR